MPTRDEKQRRRQAARERRAAEDAHERERMPISPADLRALFDALDEQLGHAPCDHSLAISERFLSERRLDPSRIVPWLQESGGFCDCELLGNVEPAWADRLRGS